MKNFRLYLVTVVMLIVPSFLSGQNIQVLRPDVKEIMRDGRKLPTITTLDLKNQKLIVSDDAIVDTIGPYPGDYDYDFGGYSNDKFLLWFKPEMDCIVKEIRLHFSTASHGMGSVQLYKTDFPADIPDDAFEENGWVGYVDDTGSWKGSSWGYNPLKELIWGGEEGYSVKVYYDDGWAIAEMDTNEAPVALKANENFAIVYTVGGQDWSSFGRQGIAAAERTSSPYPGLKFHANTEANPSGGPSGEYGWHIRRFVWDISMVVEPSSNTPPKIYPDQAQYTVLNADPIYLGCQILDANAADSTKEGVESAGFYYSINNASFNKLDMDLVDGDELYGYWEIELPDNYMNPGDELTYYFEAKDKGGMTTTSEEFSFRYFQKNENLLVFYNDDSFSPSAILPSYFALGNYEYDVWSGQIDGPLQSELVEQYDYIVQIDGCSPVTLNDDVIGTWFASGSKNLFWSSQEWGYKLCGTRDSTFTSDDWHYRYLGIRELSDKDFSFTYSGAELLPCPIVPDTLNVISRGIAEFLGDSLQLFYDPYDELGFQNYIDGIVPVNQTMAAFSDTTGLIKLGVINERDGSKSVFLPFDQLGLNTAYISKVPVKDTLGYYATEKEISSVLMAALNWFGAPMAVEKTNEKNIITTFELGQNYPNPFNPTTTIAFKVGAPGHVTLTVYNVLGQEVAKLIDEYKNQGDYRIMWDASNMKSGVYFYQLETQSFTETKKMILLR